MKHSTIEYKDAFKTLRNNALEKIDRKVGRNNTAFLSFTKISCNELATSVNAMDKWLKNVSIKEYDRVYVASKNQDKAIASTVVLELSNDPIVE